MSVSHYGLFNCRDCGRITEWGKVLCTYCVQREERYAKKGLPVTFRCRQCKQMTMGTSLVLCNKCKGKG